MRERCDSGDRFFSFLVGVIVVALFCVALARCASAQTPIIVDPSTGKYLGNLNSNPYDPNSVSNPYGRYGSRFSQDSINNPYGQYGSQFSQHSPNNPFARGITPTLPPLWTPPRGYGQ